MLEVEQKFRLNAPMERERLLESLRAAGAVELGTNRQTDIYYSQPERDLLAAGEALRVRLDGHGAALCWKGKRLQGAVKAREEIELPLAAENGDAARSLLERLGFVVVGRVAKTRDEFELAVGRIWPKPVHVAVDDVEGLGSFAELELVVSSGDADPAAKAIVAVAEILGLGKPESRSYLKMLSTDAGG